MPCRVSKKLLTKPLKKELERVRAQKRYDNVREWFYQMKSEYQCCACGESEPCCLDFHHTNQKNKLASITDLWRKKRSKKIILDEIKKCICVCSNCHRKIHSGIIELI